MDIQELLTYTPVSVRKVRKTVDTFNVSNNMIIRKSESTSIEVPTDIWTELLKDTKFSATWEALQAERGIKRATKLDQDKEKLFKEMLAGAEFAKKLA